MTDWNNFGCVISDPWIYADDTLLWNKLLQSAAYHDGKLYVKLMGLRYAGAELKPDKRFGYRLVMANEGTVTQQDVRELLAPHRELITNLILHLGGS